MPGEWVGSAGGKVYVCETRAPANDLAAHGHAGMPAS